MGQKTVVTEGKNTVGRPFVGWLQLKKIFLFGKKGSLGEKAMFLGGLFLTKFDVRETKKDFEPEV